MVRKHKIEIRRFEATEYGWNLQSQSSYEFDPKKAEEVEELANEFVREIIDRGEHW